MSFDNIHALVPNVVRQVFLIIIIKKKYIKIVKYY